MSMQNAKAPIHGLQKGTRTPWPLPSTRPGTNTTTHHGNDLFVRALQSLVTGWINKILPKIWKKVAAQNLGYYLFAYLPVQILKFLGNLFIHWRATATKVFKMLLVARSGRCSGLRSLLLLAFPVAVLPCPASLAPLAAFAFTIR